MATGHNRSALAHSLFFLAERHFWLAPLTQTRLDFRARKSVSVLTGDAATQTPALLGSAIFRAFSQYEPGIPPSSRLKDQNYAETD